MTETATTMRARVPAQSVIEELLRRQGTAPPVSPLARFFGRSPLRAADVSWYLGAQAEMAVGSLLDQLPPEWATFHALPVGSANSDIDHLVVGPGGIFTINTKHHRGKKISVARRTMLVGGRGVSHLTYAEAEAARVTSLLRRRMPMLPPVQPVVALVEPGEIAVKEKPQNVKVVDARHLPRWLSGLSVVLAEPELDEVVDILDDPVTWDAPAPASPELSPAELQEQFRALDARVQRARTRRFVWILVGFGAVTVVVTLLLADIAQFLLST